VVPDGAVHFVGAAAYNTWDRVQENEELMGRKWGGRWRRLLYNWTPDIRTEGFREWVEVANTFATGGYLFPGDMWVAPDGLVHIAWFEHPINYKLRDQHFPDIKRVYALKYAAIRDGEIIRRRTLFESGEGISREIVSSSGTPRFQVTPDNRLFAIYYVWGKDADGEKIAENRLVEIMPDGTASAQMVLPLTQPMNTFFTATPRAGNAPSYTLDMLGTRPGGGSKIFYERVRLK